MRRVERFVKSNPFDASPFLTSYLRITIICPSLARGCVVSSLRSELCGKVAQSFVMWGGLRMEPRSRFPFALMDTYSSYLRGLWHILTQTLNDGVLCFQDGHMSNTYYGHAALETLLRTAAG